MLAAQGPGSVSVKKGCNIAYEAVRRFLESRVKIFSIKSKKLDMKTSL